MACKNKNGNSSVGRCTSLGNCGCDFGAKIFGSCNTAQINIDANKPDTLNWTEVSVPEILSVPEKKPDIEHIDQVHAKAQITSVKLLETPYLFASTSYNLPVLVAEPPVPDDLTDVSNYESKDGVLVVGDENVTIHSDPLVTVPNEEGTCLTGRKLVIEGNLIQKIVYTADVRSQSVHSAQYNIPFSAFIIVYTKVEGEAKDYYVIDPLDKNKIIKVRGYKKEDIEVDLCEDFCVDAHIEDVYINAMDCRTIFKNVTLFLIAKPTPQCG